MKRKNMRFTVLAAVASASGLMLGAAHVASASILSTTSFGTGTVDTIYADNFAGPAVNVNAATTAPNAIVGNAPQTATGLDGGSATATYIGNPVPAVTSATPDADWLYSGSNSATMTSPAANVVSGEDTKSIANLTLPLVPVVGEVYDLEMTMVAAPGTGAHGLEMAFLWNNGNGHNTAPQAISNNDPVGLILDRDATSSGTTANYFEIFENTVTGSDNSFAPLGDGPYRRYPRNNDNGGCNLHSDRHRDHRNNELVSERSIGQSNSGECHRFDQRNC